ncbi:MAG TPA: sialate O-acetylesterase [Candidatus Limiplasma sp.]|nr:sialate O-acetylesterase [Candidatus Limiplasma sp.]
MKQKLQPAAVFTDHMVLSRGKNIRIFGEAADGARIVLTLGGRQAETEAKGGTFEAAFAPMDAGGPYTLTVTDGETTLTFADVMIGDVYFAGGQSNMEWPLEQAEGGPELIKTLDNPMIRYINFPHNAWLDDAALTQERQMRWKPLVPDACADISAIACHFALDLQPELGVAIGIIDCYWGGTSVTCWLDEAALGQTTAGAKLLKEYQQRNADKSDAQYDAEMKEYDDAYQAWWKRVRALQQADPDIPWEEINVKAGQCPWPQPEGRKSAFRPAGLIETMVKRVAPYTITGILYYQGEEDTKHPPYYRSLMMSLISFWRDLFRDPLLPFLFVQLPMYIGKGEEDNKSWPPVRQAQAQVYRDMRGTGLAVLIDGGEFDNVHPKDKKTVGDRLYLQALRVVYGREVQADGPYALAARRDGSRMIVTLTQPVTCDGEAPLFELAGADGSFMPARAQIDGAALILTADGIDRPAAARYAWVNYGIVKVFGSGGLPLAPFIL